MDAFLTSLTQLLTDWGYLGLFLSAFLAGSIIPFSSEAVMAVLLGIGLDPLLCILLAAAGNTLGGMTCYWIGHMGKMEWIRKYMGVDEAKLERIRKFMNGRGALMGFFTFLPLIGELFAIALGLMRSNVWLTAASMTVGKLLRYIAVYAAFEGVVALC